VSVTSILTWVALVRRRRVDRIGPQAEARQIRHAEREPLVEALPEALLGVARSVRDDEVVVAREGEIAAILAPEAEAEQPIVLVRLVLEHAKPRWLGDTEKAAKAGPKAPADPDAPKPAKKAAVKKATAKPKSEAVSKARAPVASTAKTSVAKPTAAPKTPAKKSAGKARG